MTNTQDLLDKCIEVDKLGESEEEEDLESVIFDLTALPASGEIILCELSKGRCRKPNNSSGTDECWKTDVH